MVRVTVKVLHLDVNRDECLTILLLLYTLCFKRNNKSSVTHGDFLMKFRCFPFVTDVIVIDILVACSGSSAQKQLTLADCKVRFCEVVQALLVECSLRCAASSGGCVAPFHAGTSLTQSAPPHDTNRRRVQEAV